MAEKFYSDMIARGLDHKNATSLFRHQSSYEKMKKWPLEGECPRVRAILENSGLYAVVENSVIAYDKAAVEGKSTEDKFKKNLDWKKIYELTEKLFGWDEKKTYGLFVMGKKYPKKDFKLIEIRKMYAGSLEKDGDNELLSDFEVCATTAAYLLYVLASVIFLDSKRNRVSVNLLQLLDPLEEVSRYSWGTAIVAHLNAQLAKASRERTSQMNENLALLQVWIYEHFPSLIKGNEDIQLQPTWNNTKPRGTRYKYTGAQDKEEAQKLKLLSMRQKLDNMTAKEVTFDPYKENRVGGLQDLAYYHDPLFYPYGYSMYNPHRVMRQLGYIQDSPDEDYVPPFKYKLNKCKADKKALVVAYEPEPKTEHWNDRHLGTSRVEISWWENVNEGHEVTDDYMPWYEGFSHGRVIRIDQTMGRRSNKASSAASTADTKDDSSILKLVRERMKIFMKSFCCKADKEEVIEPDQSRMYAEYCQHIENPQAEKMFADLEKQCKRTRRTTIQLTQERAQKGDGDDQGSVEEGGSQRSSPGQGPSKKSRTSSSQGSQRGRGGGRGRGGNSE
ncbi:hypothetical protein C5167_022361 [Papaver somniferum]|uniref:Aminotransferase-like plant mobile domain-containing protein n=1 Tax=Papaver somniferum TaxID=3469 RepID=A0A4Y7JHL2_PAPSO|nr:hypothetical protein C5167_022361 [Papaver somniferum]